MESSAFEKSYEILISLGVFHLIMSFLGAIGYIFYGFGFKDILSVVYASSSVDKILDGHAYSRAIRSHSLISTALCKKIFDEIEVAEEEKNHFIEYCKNKKITYENNNDTLNNINKRFFEKMSKIEKRGKTSMFCIQYLKIFSVEKALMRCEKYGYF